MSASMAEVLKMQEVERTAIGAAFRSPDAALQWPIRAEDFSDPKHGRIWEALIHAYRGGAEADPVTVGFELDEKWPGQGYMALAGEISRDFSCTPGTGTHAARIVREKGLERASVKLAQQFADKLIDQTQLVAGLKALAATRDIPAFTAAHGLRELLEHLENPPQAVPTGIGRLDDQFSGLHKGDLVLLQARPAIGKTAMGITLARNMIGAGRPVLFYSGEMPAAQIMGRLVSIEAQVPAYKFRSGKLTEAQWDKFSRAAASMQDQPLYIADAPKPMLDDLLSVSHRMAEQKGVEVIVVDYAQRIGTRRHHEAFRHSQIEIATSLKGLARELDVCVLLLAQSGRAVDQREAKSWGQMPQMGDIQESAAYEQEADMVLGLARNGEQAMLGVLKNRHGPTGLVPLHFDGPTMEFRDDAGPTVRVGRV
jgi:replicative DNA helicase